MDAKQLRSSILIASYEAKACHIGSALSCADILIDLFYHRMKPEDIFLFGKASGVVAYYAVLADKGFFSKEKLAEYLKNYPLPSTEVPGVVHSFGSCGHALSVASGMALADRNRNVYVLLSDGECQEGSTLEAVAFASHHKLKNLHVFVDDNKYQACGATKDILNLDPIYAYMKDALPNVEIVDTVKGAGVDFMEDDYRWHYKNIDKETLDKALCQI